MFGMPILVRGCAYQFVMAVVTLGKANGALLIQGRRRNRENARVQVASFRWLIAGVATGLLAVWGTGSAFASSAERISERVFFVKDKPGTSTNVLSRDTLLGSLRRVM